MKIKVLDYIESTFNKRVMEPQRGLKFDFSVSHPQDQMLYHPDWREFNTRLTVSTRNIAPVEAAQEVMREARYMIADHLYGDIYKKLQEIREDMWELGIGYGEERKLVEKFEELMEALRG